MGYIGRDNTLSTFTKQSITADGGTSFTLNQGVGDSSSILVSIGGIVQQPDVAYSASGTSLTFTSAPTNAYPIWVIYLGKELTVTNETATDNVDSQAGVGNGTATPITLVNSVPSAQSIIVTLNGIAQVPGTDFTVSGTTLTFTTAPSAAMDILVYYVALSGTVNVPVDYSVSSASQFVASGTWPAWNGAALTNAGGDATQADINGLIAALATLSFLQNIDHSTALLNFVNGWDDTFTVATSVDGEGFNVPMTHFDAGSAANTGDRLSIADGSLGQTDVGTAGLEGTVSFWWDATGTDDTDYISIFDTTATGVRICRLPTGDATFPGGFNFFARYGSPNATKINAVSSDVVGNYAAKGLIHVVCSWKIGGVEADRRFHWVIDGEIQTNHAPSLILAATAPDWTTGNFFIGSNGAGTTGVQGSLGQFYFIQDYIDLSVQANREKFVSGTGATAAPVDFGADGSTPLGTQPLIYLNNPYGTFQNNAGSGGNFTVMAHTGNAQLADGGYLDTSDSNALYSSDSFSNAHKLHQYSSKGLRATHQNMSNTQNQRQGFVFSTGSEKMSVYGITWYVNDNTASGGNSNLVTYISGLASGSIAGGNAVPSDTIITSSNIKTLPSGSGGWDNTGILTFTFSHPAVLDANTEYAIYLGYEGTNTIGIAWDTGSSVTASQCLVGRNNGTWSFSGIHTPIHYLYTSKNIDLITKGTNALTTVDSPASAPTKGHIEALVDDFNQIQIAQNTGTAIGNMTDAGGLASAFDGAQYNQGSTSNAARSTVAGTGTIGKDWGSGVTKTITGVKWWESNDGGLNQVTTMTLQGSTDNFSSSEVDLGSWTFTTDNNATTEKLSGFITTTAYRYHRIKATHSAGDIKCAEVEFYEISYPTLNTDIIGELSRDGGTTWSPATLARSSTGIDGATSEILSGDVDFTGDPSGTNVVGRIRTVNKHKVTVDGISVNWS